MDDEDARAGVVAHDPRGCCNRHLCCDFFELGSHEAVEGSTDMATYTIERTVLPPAEPLEGLVAMFGLLGAEPITTLAGPNGEHLVLPPEVSRCCATSSRPWRRARR